MLSHDITPFTGGFFLLPWYPNFPHPAIPPYCDPDHTFRDPTTTRLPPGGLLYWSLVHRSLFAISSLGFCLTIHDRDGDDDDNDDYIMMHDDDGDER